MIPRKAAAAVMRALSVDPADRFPSCAAFAEAFDEGLRSPASRAPSAGVLLALAAVVVLALAAAVTVWWLDAAPKQIAADLVEDASSFFASDSEPEAGPAVHAIGSAGIPIAGVRGYQVGSTDAEIEHALDLCGAHASRCRRDWYADEKMRVVDVASFQIDETEVSVDDFERFVERTGHQTTAERQGFSYEDTLKVGGLSWRDPGGRHAADELSDLPVVHVSQIDAQEYCSDLEMRLPTEAEWELAARGAERRVFPWGSDWDESRAHGEQSDTKQRRPVGSHSGGATRDGVYDLAGNVWEWTLTETDAGVVLKGGSFLESNPANLRSAVRMIDANDFTSSDVGFRCVLEP